MKTLIVPMIASVALAACGSGASDQPSQSATPVNGELQVEIVNYELLSDASNRFIVGLILPDNRLLAFGAVQMRFQALDAAEQPTGPVSEAVNGTYLPVPGTEAGEPSEDPQAISPATVRGVYEVEGVRFLQPGPWVVEVAARVQDLGVVQGAARFEVLAEPGAPGIGEEAPRSDNAVIGDDVPAKSLDSRTAGGAKLPDPELHQISIADAIQRGKPTVVVFSTPIYCVSRFCGPVTDLIESLQEKYGRRASFVHVEIWKDFQNDVANEAAVEWLQQDGDITEPWLFMIGADGRIASRWDNLFTEPEVEDGLRSLLGKQ